MKHARIRARAPHSAFVDPHLTGRHYVNNAFRRIIAAITLTAATATGVALTTTTARADDTAAATVETVTDLPAQVTTTTDDVVTPLDTRWG